MGMVMGLLHIFYGEMPEEYSIRQYFSRTAMMMLGSSMSFHGR